MDFDSIAVFRYPDQGSMNILKGNLKEGIHKGFVIAPFSNIIDEVSTISNCQCSNWEELDFLISYYCDTIQSYPTFNIDGVSTTETQHRKEVESIISELNGCQNKKTIACRRICKVNNLDIRKSFFSLSEALPSAFLFLFVSPKSGCWMGASPELLLKSQHNQILTYALAGTRSVLSHLDNDMNNKYEIDSANNSWDEKNLKEHQIVAQYIKEKFIKWGLRPSFSDLSTRKAGNVEHLFQTIYSESDVLKRDNFSLANFLSDFSPTPALCGMPKDESTERIARLEGFDREYYGGFCGVFESIDNFSFYVILRSLKFNKSQWCFYSGGGITANSDPDKEWNETELKLNSIAKWLKIL